MAIGRWCVTALVGACACAPISRTDLARDETTRASPRGTPFGRPTRGIPFGHAHPAERSLGVADRGIFGDLDPKLQIEPPRSGDDTVLLIDRRHGLLVLYSGGWPRKVYPLGGPAILEVGAERLELRPGDRDELAPRLARAAVRRLEQGDPPPGDRDGDGIPDPLDLLIGAHKAALNGDHYDDQYFSLSYPNGDPPRDRGACVDVIVRSVRNAGLDLQSAVFEDIRSAPAVYGKSQPDRSIDHRRVKTIAVYFRRHWQARSPKIDDPVDPLQPGDVVLLDTFPNRPGPDHIGIVSELSGESGHPLVINNWTFGYTTRPMDLLGSFVVTDRFRMPAEKR